MRTDEEEEASKCYFRNSFCLFCPICPFLSALFFVRFENTGYLTDKNGQKRTKTDKNGHKR